MRDVISISNKKNAINQVIVFCSKGTNVHESYENPPNFHPRNTMNTIHEQFAFKTKVISEPGNDFSRHFIRGIFPIEEKA